MATNNSLKLPPPDLVPLSGDSAEPIQSPVPSGGDPRQWYIDNPSTVLPPLISSSPFVPKHMITHLMRRKKNSALGVKFRPLPTEFRPDEITNMEGAMHTFVTPVLGAFLHGDYIFRGGHGMVRFRDVEENGERAWLRARRVVVSASVQPDFEGRSIMMKVSALGKDAVEGRDLGDDFEILDVASKQDDRKREEYDELLRRHMIYHLTAEHRVPGIADVANQTIGSPAAMNFLETQIMASEPDYNGIWGCYVTLVSPARGAESVVSLELLFNTAVQQLRNEISALEALCPQGYVLTIDPPSIFAREIGPSLWNRIYFAALRWLADGQSKFKHMRAFAFNDYAEQRGIGALGLVSKALEKQSHVQIVKKSSLFPGTGNYRPLSDTEQALLVVHNNSDGFGQNIESESEFGSMDGAIGANSSAAASLLRHREDLVQNLM